MIFMSRRVLLESECDSSIHTFVNLGRRINDVPSGWALNLIDIREFIPVLRYEFECYLQIRGIIAPCKVRINPRLFYKGTPLRDHLRKRKMVDENAKIPLELKFNKKELDKYHNEFEVTDKDYIETKLLVGKPKNRTNRGGWGLKRNVVSQILPLDAYNFMFPVYIDGIPAETRLNMQTRLFYRSKEVAQELERLSKIDPKRELDARIILNEEYLEFIKSSKNRDFSGRKCVICGNDLDNDSNDKCFVCLDKELTVLKLENILNYFNPEDIIYEEDLLDLGFTKGKSRIFFSKFDKYGLVSKKWDGSYELKDNNTLEKFIKQWGK